MSPALPCTPHLPQLLEMPSSHQILIQYLNKLKDVILFLFNEYKHSTLSKAFLQGLKDSFINVLRLQHKSRFLHCLPKVPKQHSPFLSCNSINTCYQGALISTCCSTPAPSRPSRCSWEPLLDSAQVGSSSEIPTGIIAQSHQLCKDRHLVFHLCITNANFACM